MIKECDSHKELDLSTYPRLNHFNYFKSFSNSYFSITVKQDITSIINLASKNNYPKFLTILYFISNAANSIPQLRQRAIGDKIVEFDNCKTSHTVAKSDGTYAYCSLDSNCSLDEYIKRSAKTQDEVKLNGSIKENEDDVLPLIFVSPIPWLHYDSLTLPIPNKPDYNPRISLGKFINENGKYILPLTLQVNHGLVDGLHVSQFYSNLTKIISNIEI